MSEQRSELIKLFGNLHNAVNENPWNQMKVSGCLLDITAKFDYDDAKFKSLEAKNAELENRLELAEGEWKTYATVSESLSKKLKIAVEALKVVGWHCSDDGSHDPDEMYDVIEKALAAINGEH